MPTNILKHTLALSLAACLISGVLMAGAQTGDHPGPSSTLADLFGDAVIAKGKGFEIKQSELDESVITIRSSTASRGQGIPPAAMARVEREVLSRMIQIQILLQRASEEDQANGKELSEKRYDALLTRAGSQEKFTRQLKSVGLTPERLQARLLQESTAEAVLERELAIKISDQAVEGFYKENPARFEQPEKVRAAHILLRTRDVAGNQIPEADKEAKRKKMEGLLKRVRDGEDFALLAAEFSDDTTTKAKGGELPPFARGQMVPVFEAAAFSLSPGQVSDIIETVYGYHIVKVYERIPPKMAELDEVADTIRQILKAQEIEKQLEPYVEKLKKEAEVEILVERLKPANAE